MPRPRVAGRRRIWDVEELDVAFQALPREGGDEALFGATGGNSWADYKGLGRGVVEPRGMHRSR